MEAHPHRIFFSHIPKCGGSTFANILRRKYTSDSILTLYSSFDKHKVEMLKSAFEPDNTTPSLILGHFPYGIHSHTNLTDKEVKYITFLRDPVKRVISLYNFIKGHKENVLFELVNSMSLHEFIEKDANIQIDNFQTRFISGDSDVPYGTCSAKMVEKALNNLRNRYVSFGIMEEFDHSLILFQQELNWQVPPFYTKINVATKKQEVAPETIALIEEKNKMDMVLYTKAHELFQSKLRGIPNLKDQITMLEANNLAFTDGLNQGMKKTKNIQKKITGIRPLSKELIGAIKKKVFG